MTFNRRNFLKAAIICGIVPSTLLHGKYEDIQDSTFHSEKKREKEFNETESNPHEIILPPRLDKSKKIAITAPASPTSTSEIASSVRYFRSLGFEVIIGETVTKTSSKYRYLSAPDEKRAEEFMNFVTDESVGMILAARGGYGVMRILPMIDFQLIRKNPKIIMGFSDITALLLGIYNNSRMISYHGPVASSSFNRYQKENILEILMPTKNNGLPQIDCPGCTIINNGVVRGKIMGGNLTILSATLGTDYEFNARNSIIFLEDISEHGYEIDRMLTQLLLAGKFDECSGIIFGKFSNLNRRNHFYPNYGYTIKEVIYQIIKKINKPCLLGMPFGHVTENSTLPLGVEAELNCDEKMLKFIGKTVNN